MSLKIDVMIDRQGTFSSNVQSYSGLSRKKKDYYVQEGKEKVIIFNLSGHGLMDLTGYDRYFANELKDGRRNEKQKATVPIYHVVPIED